MTRVKTFDNTGIATAGRLYAGDLNLIQDQYSDNMNLAQTHGVGTLQVGESGLQLLRYGSGEARLSEWFRIDGIFRGLGGIYTGAFTTAQRDAIVAGSRPYGLIILNTTNNRIEWNSGTDATPNWQPIADPAGDVLIGSTIDWPWIHTQLPATYLLPYGQAISRTAYPALHALAAASAYPHGNGDGSTTFNMPDFRGRVAVGRDDMGGAAASRVTSGGSGILGTTLGAVGGVQNITLAVGEIPVHSHGSTALTVTGAPGITGTISNGTLTLPNHVHSHALTLPDHVHSHTFKLPNHGHSHTLTLPDHYHTVNDPNHNHAIYDPGHKHPVHHGSNVNAPGSNNFMGTVDDYGEALTSPGMISVGTGIQTYGAGTNITVGAITSAPAIPGGVGNPTTNPTIPGAVGSATSAPAINGTIGNPTSNPAITGSVANGTLAATVGTLDVGGTTDNAGGGAAHNNMIPAIIVNKAMRVL